MNNPSAFIDKIKNFKAESIDDGVLDKTNKLIADNKDAYSPDKMKTVAAAAMYLCSWSLNILTFNYIYKNVKPLQDAKAAALEDLD